MLTMYTPYVSNHSVLETIHWMSSPPFSSDILWRCGPDRSFFCAYSTHAGWSNNPFIARRSFVRDRVLPVGDADWTRTIEGAINLSPHLWDDACYILAQGEGLFTHSDIDRPLTQQSPAEDPFHPNGAVATRLARIDDWI